MSRTEPNQSTLLHCADWPFSSRHEYTFGAPVIFKVQLPKEEEYYSARHVNSDDHRFQPFAEIVSIIDMYCLMLPDQPRSIAKLQILKKLLESALESYDLKKFIKFADEFASLTASFRNTRIPAYPLPEPIAHGILEATYSRVVSPHTALLRKYRSFSCETYGELMPGFLSVLFKQLGLNENSRFADLGSGVGNCVCQAALEFKCDSWGIELLENPHKLALAQARELKARSAAWGLECGKMVFMHGSITEQKDVMDELQKSTAILANNLLFDGQLNNSIKDMIEKLDVGKRIASLQPFFKIRARSAVCRINDAKSLICTKHEYPPGSVTWAPSGGVYYITETIAAV